MKKKNVQKSDKKPAASLNDKNSDKKETNIVKSNKLVKTDNIKRVISVSPNLKVRSLIKTFNENVKMKNDKNLPCKSDKMMIDDKKEIKLKDAFGLMMESVQGGGPKIFSPSRKHRKKIGGLKTPLKDRNQSFIDEWLGKRNKK